MKLPPLSKTDTPATRERIIEAAMKVFSRDGLHRATTRIIAEEAGVNEVTLFRHFQNKDGLLSEVMTQAVLAHAQAGMGEEKEWTGDLKRNLLRFAKGFYAMMVRDEAFMRTMVGEAKRHPDHARKIILEAVRPVRARFIANLEAARKSGQIRKGIDLGAAADCLTGSLFGGMLRISAGCSEGYTPEQYVATCVEIFAAGLAPAPKA
jgi:AcrR family transcriptional regulator